MAEITPPSGQPAVRLPDWDDVLHVKPRTPPSNESRKAWNAYLADEDLKKIPVDQLKARLEPVYAAGGDVNGIPRAELDTLLRGRQIYQSMQNSVVPGWRQKMVKALTVLDNIEDQISTVEWVTRPVTRLWAPTRAAANVARRTNNVISSIESVLAGPTLAKAMMKQRAARSSRRSSRAASGKSGKLMQAVSWLGDNKGHLLEAGQAMDTWAGVGISLGAIFGGIEEAQDRLLISAWEGAKFTVAGAARAFTSDGSELDDILAMQQDASVSKVRRTGAPLVDQMLAYTVKKINDTGPIADFARTALSNAFMAIDPEGYTKPERALALEQYVTQVPLLGEILAQIRDPRVLTMIPELEASRPRVTSDYTRDLLEEAGATLTARGELTGAWQEPSRTVHQAVDQDLEETIVAMASWLPETEEADDDRLIHSLIEGTGTALGATLAGAEDRFAIIPDPATRAEILAYHLDALPPRGTSKETLTAWLNDQVAAIVNDPAGYTWRAWRDVTAKYWNVDHLSNGTQLRDGDAVTQLRSSNTRQSRE